VLEWSCGGREEEGFWSYEDLCSDGKVLGRGAGDLRCSEDCLGLAFAVSVVRGRVFWRRDDER